MPQEFKAGRVFATRLLCPQIRNITIAAESLAAARRFDGTYRPATGAEAELPGWMRKSTRWGRRRPSVSRSCCRL